jgi:hypothetical protein
MSTTTTPAAIALALIGTLIQPDAPALDNAYVRVTRNAAPCASPKSPGCATDRIIVALGDVAVNSIAGTKSLERGEIAVFGTTDAYVQPVAGAYFEVVLKADRPPAQAAKETILAEKNSVIYDNPRFVVFDERLEPGETRPRHSHNVRVVIQLNATRLQQQADGQPEVTRDIVPDQAAFNEPVIHAAKNVGDKPLRGVVIELKPQ